jgi:hypothetical protein
LQSGSLMQTSSARRKTSFVPWLAALLIGATVHAGWLIHELREPDKPAVVPVAVAIEARQVVRPTPALNRAKTLTPSCRGASLASSAVDDDEFDLDLWIHQTDRYTYAIDRRVLERVALADANGDLLARLGVVARALGLAEPIELRNIRAGTPLFVLGLRTGDRVHAISTRGGEAIERVEVAIERRGRPIELVYRLI